MRFEHRKILYLIFGLLPGVIPLLIAVFGLLYALVAGLGVTAKGEYKNLPVYILFVTFGATMAYSYVCGYMVIFKKEQIIKRGFVITGLILGILVCGAYSLVFSGELMLQLCFLFPTIVGVCLVLEFMPLKGNKKCT